MPLLGFGTYAKNNPETYPAEVVYNAIRLGFRVSLYATWDGQKELIAVCISSGP